MENLLPSSCRCILGSLLHISEAAFDVICHVKTPFLDSPTMPLRGKRVCCAMEFPCMPRGLRAMPQPWHCHSLPFSMDWNDADRVPGRSFLCVVRVMMMMLRGTATLPASPWILLAKMCVCVFSAVKGGDRMKRRCVCINQGRGYSLLFVSCFKHDFCWATTHRTCFSCCELIFQVACIYISHTPSA